MPIHCVTFSKVLQEIKAIVLGGSLGGLFCSFSSFLFEPWLRPDQEHSPWIFRHLADGLVYSLWASSLPFYYFYGFFAFCLLCIVYKLVNACFPSLLWRLKKNALARTHCVESLIAFLQDMAWGSLLGIMAASVALGLYIFSILNPFGRLTLLPIFHSLLYGVVSVLNIQGNGSVSLSLESFGWVFTGTYLLVFILTACYHRQVSRKAKTDRISWFVL